MRETINESLYSPSMYAQPGDNFFVTMRAHSLDLWMLKIQSVKKKNLVLN